MFSGEHDLFDPSPDARKRVATAAVGSRICLEPDWLRRFSLPVEDMTRWARMWVCALMGVAVLAQGPPGGRTCLSTGIKPHHRRFLLDASGKESEMPVGILSGTWPSAPLLSHLVRILIMEVIGYHAVIDERAAEYGGSPIYGLAGCINFNAPTDKKCGELETTMHVSTDSWVGGYLADFEQMQKDFPDIAPEDLGSVGYDGEETMYVSDAVFDAAYTQTGVILDHHKGYNRSHHNAKLFFDSVADIQLSELKQCSESELNNPSRMEPYARFSGDADGVVSSDGGVVAKCPDAYWWPSPACRHDMTECIPLITGGNGWRIQALMQWATAYDMPVAVAVAKAWGNYVELISSKRVLFYWWVPDSTFIQMQPHQIHFPRNNPKEWAAGDKKTSLASSYISNMVSADLATKASKVRSFMMNVRFSLQEVQDMLMLISLGDIKEKVACEWIKDNVDVWKEWIPVDTKCLAGFGMVDSDGEFVSVRDNATGCDICKAGTFSEKFSDETGKTFRCTPCQPGYSQESTYSTRCELWRFQTACARGMVSKTFGSESCTPCGVGEYQPNQAQTSCLPCNDTRTTQLLGATTQQECVCEAGFIEDFGLQCIPCRQGVLCPLGSTISKLLNSNGSAQEPRIKAGYSSEAVAPLETYRCPAADCPGGAPGSCGGGKVGATCGACPEGQFYLEDVNFCKPCSDSILPVLLSVGLSLLVITLVASYYLLPSKYRATASPTMMVSAIAGLTIATLQVLGVLATTVKDVTKSRGFLDAGRIFVLDGFGFSCAGTNTAMFQMTVLFFWCIPWSFVLLGCISNVIPVLKKKNLAWEWRRTTSLIGNFLQVGFTTMASIALVPFMYLERRCWNAALEEQVVGGSRQVLASSCPMRRGEGTYRLDMRVNSSGDAAFLLEVGLMVNPDDGELPGKSQCLRESGIALESARKSPSEPFFRILSLMDVLVEGVRLVVELDLKEDQVTLSNLEPGQQTRSGEAISIAPWLAERNRAQVMSRYTLPLAIRATPCHSHDMARAPAAKQARPKHWREALQLLAAQYGSSSLPDLRARCGAIRTCGGRWPQALQLLADCARDSLEANLIIFSAAISACEKGNTWQHAIHLLSHVVLAMQADEIIFNAGISACAKGSQWMQALQLFISMEDFRVVPDVISCNSVASACERSQQWQMALCLLFDIGRRELDATIISYNTAISACGQSAQWLVALELFQVAQERRLESTAASFTAAISACDAGTDPIHVLRAEDRAGLHMRSFEIFSEMPSQELLGFGRLPGYPAAGSAIMLSPGIISYGAMMSACERAAQWELALAFFDLGTSLRNIITFGAAISACAKGGEWQRALLLLSGLARAKLKANHVVYNAAISACEKRGQWQAALVLLDQLQTEEDFSADVITYSACISACQDGSRDSGLSLVAYSAACSACAKAFQWQSALFLFSALRGGPQPLSLASYDAALEAAVRGGRLQSAVEIFGQLQRDALERGTMEWAMGPQGDSELREHARTLLMDLESIAMSGTRLEQKE
eukprot:s1096_g36.t2